jgi:hypothetical protein
MKWLRRALVEGPYLALCTTEAGYKKAMRHMEIKEPLDSWISSGAHATTHTYADEDGHVSAVVCVRPDHDKTGIQVASLLTHEAVHVWQHWRDFIGEKNPSSEFEAYSIQNIAQTLMEAYAEQIEAKRGAA